MKTHCRKTPRKLCLKFTKLNKMSLADIQVAMFGSIYLENSCALMCISVIFGISHSFYRCIIDKEKLNKMLMQRIHQSKITTCFLYQVKMCRTLPLCNF